MTPGRLAALHARAMAAPPPWPAAEIAAVLAGPGVVLLAEGEAGEDLGGFLIGRVVAGEAELLTVAVDPAAQGQGLGTRLVARFLAEAAAQGAVRVVLEVAEGNAAARALYARAGFAEAGRRRGYMRHADGRREDALVMLRDLSPAPRAV